MTAKDVHYLSIDYKRHDVIERWNSGRPLLSVRLSDLADAPAEYEDTLQQLMFEIFSKWEGGCNVQGRNSTYSKAYTEFCVQQGLRFENLTLMQLQLAKDFAWRLLFYGYKYMMQGAPKDRIIKVEKKPERKLKLLAEGQE